MKKINIPMGDTVCEKDILGWGQDPHKLLKRIKTVVARRYGLKETDFESENKAVTVVFPRQLAIYLTCDLTLLSLPEIVKAFGNNRSAVIEAKAKIPEYLRTDILFTNCIEELVAEIQSTALCE